MLSSRRPASTLLVLTLGVDQRRRQARCLPCLSNALPIPRPQLRVEARPPRTVNGLARPLGPHHAFGIGMVAAWPGCSRVPRGGGDLFEWCSRGGSGTRRVTSAFILLYVSARPGPHHGCPGRVSASGGWGRGWLVVGAWCVYRGVTLTGDSIL